MKCITPKKENYWWQTSKKIYMLGQENDGIFGIIFNSSISLNVSSTQNYKSFKPLPLYLKWMWRSDGIIICSIKSLINALEKIQDDNSKIVIEEKTIHLYSLSCVNGYLLNGGNPQKIKTTLIFNSQIFVRGMKSLKPKDWPKSYISFKKVDGQHMGMTLISPMYSFGIITRISDD